MDSKAPAEGRGMGKESVKLRFLVGRFLVIASVIFVAIAALIVCLVQIDDSLYADGYIVARDREELHASAPAVVMDIHVHEGDRVKKGQLLGLLEDTKARNALARQQEALAKARSRHEVYREEAAKLKIDTLPEKLRFTKLEVERAELRLSEAEEEWRTAGGLMKKGIVSNREYRRLQTKYLIAKKELEEAQRKHAIVGAGLRERILAKSKEQADVHREAVVHAEHEVRRLKAELARTRLVAPADGVVIKSTVRGGDAVKPGDTIIKIQTSDRLELRINVTGDQIARIKPGQEALIYPQAYSYSKYGLAEGKVLSVSSSPEEAGGKWGYMVRISVDKTPQPLPLGSNARGRVIVRRASIIRILLDSD